MKSLCNQVIELMLHKKNGKNILLIDPKNELVKSENIERNILAIARQRNSKHGVFTK